MVPVLKRQGTARMFGQDDGNNYGHDGGWTPHTEYGSSGVRVAVTCHDSPATLVTITSLWDRIRVVGPCRQPALDIGADCDSVAVYVNGLYMPKMRNVSRW